MFCSRLLIHLPVLSLFPLATVFAQGPADPDAGLRIQREPGIADVYEFRFWGRAGRNYYLAKSGDLLSWQYFPVIEPGQDAVVSYSFVDPAPRVFVRLRHEPASTSDPYTEDSDGDGLTNQQEIIFRSDLFKPDTDNDGLTDYEESRRGGDPRLADSDGDGVVDMNDGWLRDPAVSPPLLTETAYTVVPLTSLLPAEAGLTTRSIDNSGRILFQSGSNIPSDGGTVKRIDVSTGALKTLYGPRTSTNGYTASTQGDWQSWWAVQQSLNDISYGLGYFGPYHPHVAWLKDFEPVFRQFNKKGDYGFSKWESPRFQASVVDSTGDEQLVPLVDGLDIPGGALSLHFSAATAVGLDGGVVTVENIYRAGPPDSSGRGEAKLVSSSHYHRPEGGILALGGEYRISRNLGLNGQLNEVHEGSMFMAHQVGEGSLAAGRVYGPAAPLLAPAVSVDGEVQILQQTFPNALYMGLPFLIPRPEGSLDDLVLQSFSTYEPSQWLADRDGDGFVWSQVRVWNPDAQVEFINSSQMGNRRLELIGRDTLLFYIIRNGVVHSFDELVDLSWSISQVKDINDHGLLLAEAKRTQDASGQAIPTAQQITEPVLLVPTEVLAPPPDSVLPQLASSALAGKPTPEVELKIAEASVNSAGDLEVVVTGTVRDRLSELLADSSARVSTLFIAIDGVAAPVEIPLVYTAVDELHRRFDSTTPFEQTLLVPNPKPRGYFVTATTSPNAAGQDAWDKAVVGLGWHGAQGGSADSDKLSLVLTGAPGAGAIDTLRAYWGTRPVAAGDPLFTETSASSLGFAGTITVAGVTCPASIQARPATAFTAAVVDVLEVKVTYQPAGGPPVAWSGLWHETGPGSLHFTPDDLTWNSSRLVVRDTLDLPGSQVREPEPLVLRLGLAGPGAQVRVNGQAYPLKELTVAGRAGVYAVADANATRPRIFLPGETALPAELAVADAAAEGDEILWELLLNGQVFELARTIIVPESDSSDQPLAALIDRLPKWVQAGGGGANAPPAIDGQDWLQPGDAVSLRDLRTAYAFVYPDAFSQILLSTYDAAGHSISLEDELGDLAVKYTNGHFTLEIEHDDDDINPAIAAQLLYSGLQEAFSSGYAFREAVTDAADNAGLLTQSLGAWRDNAIAAAGKHCAAATELYLSGIGIVNEGADWALVISDVSEGHYTSLAAALPFIPIGVMKAARIERAATREALQTALSAERVSFIQLLYTIEKDAERFAVANQTVLSASEISGTLRRILAGPGGPVPIPTWRGQLEYRMSKLVPRPASGPHIAHHDLIWARRREFAEAGIDVNETLFGRWAPKADHDRWHYQMQPSYNQFWNDWWDQHFRNGTTPTRQQILDKLTEARSIYQ